MLFSVNVTRALCGAPFFGPGCATSYANAVGRPYTYFNAAWATVGVLLFVLALLRNTCGYCGARSRARALQRTVLAICLACGACFCAVAPDPLGLRSRLTFVVSVAVADAITFLVMLAVVVIAAFHVAVARIKSAADPLFTHRHRARLAAAAALLFLFCVASSVAKLWRDRTYFRVQLVQFCGLALTLAAAVAVTCVCGWRVRLANSRALAGALSPAATLARRQLNRLWAFVLVVGAVAACSVAALTFAVSRSLHADHHFPTERGAWMNEYVISAAVLATLQQLAVAVGLGMYWRQPRGQHALAAPAPAAVGRRAGGIDQSKLLMHSVSSDSGSAEAIWLDETDLLQTGESDVDEGEVADGWRW